MIAIGTRVTWRGLTGVVVRYPSETRREPGRGVIVRWDDGHEGEPPWQELRVL